MHGILNAAIITVLLKAIGMKTTIRRMSTAQIIEAFKELPAEQRAEVLRAAQAHGPELTRRLSPEEIGELAEKLAAATTEGEAAAIKRQMINGYYGAVIDA
jgi:DNA-binding transcriptional ArsR family regulator